MTISGAHGRVRGSVRVCVCMCVYVLCFSRFAFFLSSVYISPRFAPFLFSPSACARKPSRRELKKITQ